MSNGFNPLPAREWRFDLYRLHFREDPDGFTRIVPGAGGFTLSDSGGFQVLTGNDYEIRAVQNDTLTDTFLELV